MGEQIWSASSHNIRPRDPVHLLPVGRPVQLAQHPAQQTTAYHPKSNQMKHALHARCAAANWVDHFLWVLMGLRAAAREDDRTTPPQSVLGSPLILLPGQFLDSPELPSKIFLEQFSKTLSAAEHPSTKPPPTAAAAA